MNTFYSAALVILIGVGAITGRAQGPTPFDQLKKLQGEWIDLDGVVGPKGAVLATYRLTGGGTAVIETMFPGSNHEMTTVYHRDGKDIALTHYCSGGTQPRMRASSPSGNVLTFAYDGGTNFNPAKDDHMHNGRIEFISADEIGTDEWFVQPALRKGATRSGFFNHAVANHEDFSWEEMHHSEGRNFVPAFDYFYEWQLFRFADV